MNTDDVAKCPKCGKCIYPSDTTDVTKCDCDNPKENYGGYGGIVGWICPICGAGLSPYTQRCPCQGYPLL